MTRPPINAIIHGDCLEVIPRLRTPINCVIADPPYGVHYRSNYIVKPESLTKIRHRIADDDTIEAAQELFAEVMEALAPKLAEEADLYVFGAPKVMDAWLPFMQSFGHLGIGFYNLLIWSKSGVSGMGDVDGNWGNSYEVIYYLKKGSRTVNIRRNNVLEIDRVPPTQTIHPTEKPVALLQTLIEVSTHPGDFVLDPFSGSGSTGVAAKRTGRDSLGIEIEERYIADSQHRLAAGSLFGL